MADLLRQYHTLIELGIPVGAALASAVFTLVLLMSRYLKSQLENGDKRSLRRAVDDLQADFTEHRRETREHMEKLADKADGMYSRLANVESRLVLVEHRS